MKTMRILFVVLLWMMVPVAKAQYLLQKNVPKYFPQNSPAANNNLSDSVALAKKWSVSRQVGLYTGMGFFNGGHTTVFSVPVGLQLNRRLSNNWVAFAGIAVAPAYINLNHSLQAGNGLKSLPGNSVFNSRLCIYGRAEMGLMYTNDQKTFSISGSIGVERSNYPWLTPAATTGLRPVFLHY